MSRPITEQEFWQRVDKNGPVPEHCPELGPCWLWLGSTNSDGYGSMKVHGKTVGAHRYAYEVQNGPIPEGKSVLHRCDNRPCMRGSHFFLGTQLDNVRDMFAKGRGNRARGDRNGSRLHPESRPDLTGEKCGHAKLTWAAVRIIRARYATGRISHATLAKEYGVVTSTIQQLVEGKTWKEVSV